jgi:hypothetical protein
MKLRAQISKRASNLSLEDPDIMATLLFMLRD